MRFPDPRFGAEALITVHFPSKLLLLHILLDRSFYFAVYSHFRVSLLTDRRQHLYSIATISKTNGSKKRTAAKSTIASAP